MNSKFKSLPVCLAWPRANLACYLYSKSFEFDWPPCLCAFNVTKLNQSTSLTIESALKLTSNTQVMDWFPLTKSTRRFEGEQANIGQISGSWRPDIHMHGH